MKKTITILLCLVMLLSAFAGCSGQAETPAQTAAPESQAPAAEDEAPEPAESVPPTGENLDVYNMDTEEAVEAAKSGDIDFSAHKALCEGLSADFPVADGESLTIWLSYETSSLQFVEGGEMQNIICYQMLEDLTGVHLEMTVADMTTSSEKFNIMAASGDYTDLLPGSSYTTGVDAAINDEVIIELTDIIDQYCPNYKTLINSDAGLYGECQTPEGRFGSFNRIKDGVTTPGNAGAFMRMDWLDELGMEVPATYDELETVLTAFKDEFGATEPLMLGDSIIPQGGNLTAGYDFTAQVASTMGGGGNAGGFFQKDGTVIYGALTEEFKDFTKMLGRWYEKGLISENCLTRATNPFSSDIIDPVLNGQTGMFYSNQPFGDNYNSMDETGTINFYPVRDVGMTADQQLHFYEDITLLANSGDLSISTTCADVELAARYIDSLYSHECYLIINYGRQGETWDYDENGVPQFLQSALDNFTSTNTAMAVWTTQSLPCVYAESRLHFTFGEGAAAAFEVWGTNKDNSYGIGNRYSLTSEESQQISTISTDILTYIAEHYWKFITGEEDIDAAWDGYVDTIYSMGYETMEQIVQQAYDRAYK